MNIINNPPDFRCVINDSLLDSMNLSFLCLPQDYRVITNNITFNPNEIKMRQKLFDYIAESPESIKFFDRLLQNIKSMRECIESAKVISGYDDNEALYYHFREFLFFIDSVEDICKTLKDSKVPQLNDIFNMSKSIQGETWYINAKHFIENLDDTLKSIKSVTIGINLNAQLAPVEAGIVAIESEPYVTNSLFDKMFAPQIKDKKMICVAPLGIREEKLESNELLALNIGLYHALNKIMRGSLKKIRGVFNSQFKQAASFLLNLEDEIRFIEICTKYIIDMQAKGITTCFPEIVTKNQKISGLCNPNLINQMNPDNIVKNDALFDESGKVHLIVGVNSGGKSVYLKAVGIAQILFQLGMPITARRADMVVCNEILSCFSNKIVDKVGGRFENECKMVSELCKLSTEKSLILIDEMFSSTNSYDASILAMKIVAWFAHLGCCVVYTTHIYELIDKIDEINSKDGIKSKVDIWSADYQSEQYTYRILRKPYNYESSVMKIFKEYGMDFLLKNQ